LPPAFAQNHPHTENLSTIIEGLEHAAFSDIPEVELQYPTNNNVSTTTARSSQNAEGASSTQTNGDAMHQSPRGHPDQFKSSLSNFKIGRMKPPRMKPQKK
jgi:hypothetical protein